MTRTRKVNFLAIVLCFALVSSGLLTACGVGAASRGAQNRDRMISVPDSANAIPANGGPEAAPDQLELRGVGIRIDEWAQTQVWSKLKRQTDPNRSVLSTSAGDYPASRAQVQEGAANALTSSFKYSAGDGVENWPIPVIIFGPPKDADLDNRIANFITTNRQRASLAQHMFLTVQAVNVADPQAQIDFLFDFFAKNPEVPQALVYGFDGMAVRTWFGDAHIPEGQHVPTQFDAMVGLLVARTDRVDTYMRPFVTNDPAGAGPDDRKYDSVKAANFFRNVNSEPREGLDVSPPTVEHWEERLPALWQAIDNKGPGEFKPITWFPVRWARWQLNEFDNAPMLGYLHRPVTVRLMDSHGEPLNASAKREALSNGWAQVCMQLPPDEKVVRVFFDSVTSASVLPLLHTLATRGAPDPTSLSAGFDIGRRIGNVGIMGSMTGIALSAMASYDGGNGSVTASITPDGNLHFTLVTPPDEAQKAANMQLRHLPADPFRHLIPGG
jgi:hypothetical protein